MNLKNISNNKLLLATRAAIQTETSAVAEVIRHIREISERKLYLDMAYPSLFEMLTQYFGYCAGSAQLRVNAMRLTLAVPEVEEKLEKGELKLSTAATLQSFFKAQPCSKELKLQLIEECKNKTTRELERELARRRPEFMERDSIRALGQGRVRFSITISEELKERLDALQARLSHRVHSYEELLDYLAGLRENKCQLIQRSSDELSHAIHFK